MNNYLIYIYMGNIPSGTNPFATNDVKGDNLRQERELKAILRPKEPIQRTKTNKYEFEPQSIFTDTQQAEMTRIQNEEGGKALCRGEECEPNILPIVNPNE